MGKNHKTSAGSSRPFDTGASEAPIAPADAVSGQTVPCSTIGDRVWVDANGNGIQDAGEQGAANVTVKLAGAGADGVFGTADDVAITTRTNVNGTYNFTGLSAGDYTVQVVAPSGFGFAPKDRGGNDALDSDAAANGKTDVIRADGVSTLTSIDIGLVEKANGSIGDRVFVDANGNGVQDTGEAGLAGVSVTPSAPATTPRSPP